MIKSEALKEHITLGRLLASIYNFNLVSELVVESLSPAATLVLLLLKK